MTKQTDPLKMKMASAALSLGADLVGVADLGLMRRLPTLPEGLLSPFRCAVSMAIALPHTIFAAVTQAPTPEYAALYQTVNRRLDDLAMDISRLLEKNGATAMPIPASQVLDRSEWRAALSHKAVARMAGLGWQGKNLLLVTPEFGSRVRLVTVLTDAPLTADGPVANRCGACTCCQDACPAGAIRGVGTETHYPSRNAAMHFSKCVEKLTVDFAARENIGVPICGICIRACPFTMKGKGRSMHRSGDQKISTNTSQK